MKVLVTGSEGYIGSLLAPHLMQRGHIVTGLDTGYYKAGWLYSGTPCTPLTLTKDIRHITRKDLEGYEAVVHMAELSNDPTGQLSPTITHAINHKGSSHLAYLAKQAGVRRFVYMSSCSVYGLASDGKVTENSSVNPQTAYARCKVLVERDLQDLADDHFSPTLLRNATAFGVSPRMRFDLVLNNLAGFAWTTDIIEMNSDGTPWRPLVHVLDIVQAITMVLEVPRNLVHNEIINVGTTIQNYRVKDLAEIMAEVFPGCRLKFGKQGADNRSYRVSFAKIHHLFPDFKCNWDAYRGALQLHELFRRIDLDPPTFEYRGFTRLKQLEYLLHTGQIDAEFFWA